MKDWLKKVSIFCMDIVKLPAPKAPRLLSPDRLQFYLGAANEELREFTEATHDGDIGEAADALVDLIYFTLGRLYEMGVPADTIFDDVHRANMTKERGRKPREVRHDDDAIKPADWTPPDHSWLACLSPAAIEAAKLRATKTADYDGDGISKGDYFPFRELSHAQMIWTKALRIRSLAKGAYDAGARGDGSSEPNHESLRDSLVDIVNYATYAVEDIDGMLERGGGA